MTFRIQPIVETPDFALDDLPVYIVHGIAPPDHGWDGEKEVKKNIANPFDRPTAIQDGAEWRDAIEAWRRWGYSGRIHIVHYYECDHTTGFSPSDYARLAVDVVEIGDHTRPGDAGEPHLVADTHKGSGCGGKRPHNWDTPIEHVAYHLAWAIHDQTGGGRACVNVAVHSMGGLITRYMLGAVATGEEGFPSRVCVRNLVTFGTPHTGGMWAHKTQLGIGGVQAAQMNRHSKFYDRLNGVPEFRDPRNVGGEPLDVTALASAYDDQVEWRSGAGFDMYDSFDWRTALPRRDDRQLYGAVLDHRIVYFPSSFESTPTRYRLGHEDPPYLTRDQSPLIRQGPFDNPLGGSWGAEQTRPGDASRIDHGGYRGRTSTARDAAVLHFDDAALRWIDLRGPARDDGCEPAKHGCARPWKKYVEPNGFWPVREAFHAFLSDDWGCGTESRPWPIADGATVEAVFLPGDAPCYYSLHTGPDVTGVTALVNEAASRPESGYRVEVLGTAAGSGGACTGDVALCQPTALPGGPAALCTATARGATAVFGDRARCRAEADALGPSPAEGRLWLVKVAREEGAPYGIARITVASDTQKDCLLATDAPPEPGTLPAIDLRGKRLVDCPGTLWGEHDQDDAYAFDLGGVATSVEVYLAVDAARADVPGQSAKVVEMCVSGAGQLQCVDVRPGARGALTLTSKTDAASFAVRVRGKGDPTVWATYAWGADYAERAAPTPAACGERDDADRDPALDLRSAAFAQGFEGCRGRLAGGTDPTDTWIVVPDGPDPLDVYVVPDPRASVATRVCIYDALRPQTPLKPCSDAGRAEEHGFFLAAEEVPRRLFVEVRAPDAPASGLAYTWTLRREPWTLPFLTGLSCGGPYTSGEQVRCTFASRAAGGKSVEYLVDWGDGSGPERVPATGLARPEDVQTVARRFSIPDPGACPGEDVCATRRVSVQVIDAEGLQPARGARQAEIELRRNAPPVLASVACEAKGLDAACRLVAEDASSGVHYAIDWGDGSPPTRHPAAGTVPPGATLVPHAYPRAGAHRVTVVASDDADPVDGTPASSSPVTTTVYVPGGRACAFDPSRCEAPPRPEGPRFEVVDLVVSPSAPKDGEKVHFTATLQNVGTAAGDTAPLRASSAWGDVERDLVGPFAPGERVPVAWSWTARAGAARVAAHASPGTEGLALDLPVVAIGAFVSREVDAVAGSEVVAREGARVVAREGAEVVAESGSEVVALPGSEVVAHVGSEVDAFDGAEVVAHDGSVVRAHDASEVEAHDGAEVDAFDTSEVVAHDGAVVRAHDAAEVAAEKGAEVDAFDASEVVAHDGAVVRAHDGAVVEAVGAAEVVAHDAAVVVAQKGATVEAHDAAEVVARDGAVVEAHDASTVVAHDSAVVEAHDASTVVAHAGAVVRAHDAAAVEAHKGSEVATWSATDVLAYDGSRVEAYEGASVVAYAGSEVIAHAGSTILAYEGARVVAHKGSQVVAFRASEIEAYDGAVVAAVAAAVVDAYAGSEVTAYDGAVVEAHEAAEVVAHAGAVVEAYAGAVVVAHEAAVVKAHEGAEVRPYEADEIDPYESEEIEPYESEEVEPYESEEIDPYESEEVEQYESEEVEQYESEEVEQYESEEVEPYESEEVEQYESEEVEQYESEEVDQYESRDVEPYESREVEPYQSREVEPDR